MNGTVHIIKNWPCGGGMEKIVRMHLAAGESLVSVFGKGDEPGVVHLGLTPGDSLSRSRRVLGQAVSRLCPNLLVYHNGYGLTWGLDGVYRKCLYLHTDYAKLENWLKPLIPHMDGCFCVNKRLEDKIRGMADAPPVWTLPHGVIPVGSRPAPNKMNAPVVVGYSGRVETEQKRLDRLPEFVRELANRGISYRMEVLGDGSFLETLKSQCEDNPNVVFHGYQAGDAYWSIIESWKYILFLSDYEGLPLALLEAVSKGAVPIYPDFHGGNDWVCGLHGELLYPVGDSRQAVARLAKVESQWDESDWESYLNSAMNLSSRHTEDAYWDFYHKVAADFPAKGDNGRESLWQRLANVLPLWVFHRLDTHRRT
jgi:glycosyltransferase involved in cell wall biosynthesis